MTVLNEIDFVTLHRAEYYTATDDVAAALADINLALTLDNQCGVAYSTRAKLYTELSAEDEEVQQRLGVDVSTANYADLAAEDAMAGILEA